MFRFVKNNRCYFLVVLAINKLSLNKLQLYRITRKRGASCIQLFELCHSLKFICPLARTVVNICDHNGCHLWCRNCSPFRSTRVHPGFLVGFLLLHILFSACPFFPFLFWPLYWLYFFHLRLLISLFGIFKRFCHRYSDVGTWCW